MVDRFIRKVVKLTPDARLLGGKSILLLAKLPCVFILRSQTVISKTTVLECKEINDHLSNFFWSLEMKYISSYKVWVNIMNQSNQFNS